MLLVVPLHPYLISSSIFYINYTIAAPSKEGIAPTGCAAAGSSKIELDEAQAGIRNRMVYVHMYKEGIAPTWGVCAVLAKTSYLELFLFVSASELLISLNSCELRECDDFQRGNRTGPVFDGLSHREPQKTICRMLLFSTSCRIASAD